MAKKKKSATSLVGEPSVMYAGGNDYRAEDDYRALTRAGEIMSDRDRMRAAKDHGKKQQKHMEKACK